MAILNLGEIPFLTCPDGCKMNLPAKFDGKRMNISEVIKNFLRVKMTAHTSWIRFFFIFGRVSSHQFCNETRFGAYSWTAQFSWFVNFHFPYVCMEFHSTYNHRLTWDFHSPPLNWSSAKFGNPLSPDPYNWQGFAITKNVVDRKNAKNIALQSAQMSTSWVPTSVSTVEKFQIYEIDGFLELEE